MDKERNGGFEKMARIGGWLISVCSIGSGSGIGQRLPRIDCKGAKPIRAITSMPRSEIAPQGSRIDFVFH